MYADRGKLADGGANTTGVEMAGMVVPVSKMGPHPDARSVGRVFHRPPHGHCHSRLRRLLPARLDPLLETWACPEPCPNYPPLLWKHPHAAYCVCQRPRRPPRQPPSRHDAHTSTHLRPSRTSSASQSLTAPSFAVPPFCPSPMPSPPSRGSALYPNQMKTFSPHVPTSTMPGQSVPSQSPSPIAPRAICIYWAPGNLHLLPLQSHLGSDPGLPGAAPCAMTSPPVAAAVDRINNTAAELVLC